MEYNVAFSGSGFRLGAHAGAMDRLYSEPGFKLNAVAGTSGGALMAALLALYNNPKAIYAEYVKLDTDKMLEFNFSALRWCSYSKGKYFGKLLEQHFGDMTLRDLVNKGHVKHITVMSTDINTGRPYVFSSTDTPDAKVKDAVRASCAFPFVFTPVRLETGEVLLDGGLVNNITVNMLPKSFTNAGGETRNIGINVTTTDSSEYYSKVKSIGKIAVRLLNILMESLSRSHIRLASDVHDAHTIHVDVTRISSIFDQDMTDDEKFRLNQAGYTAVDTYFRNKINAEGNA